MQLNILVDPNYRAVITDFGSARRIGSASEQMGRDIKTTMTAEPHEQALAHAPEMESLKAKVTSFGKSITMTGPAWTIRWAAPELLGGDLPDLASDIWALGWICWEVR